MKRIVDKLINLNKTISTMESCTGGYIASSITNIEGASSILKFSAVTYSNEFKILMGVDSLLIDKYSVYSKEVAIDMAKAISKYSSSNYGVGITGRINREDINNIGGDVNKIYICIFDRDINREYLLEVDAIDGTRLENKKYILSLIEDKLEEVLFNEEENK